MICHSVVQYLPDEAAAIDNLGAATRDVMYLELPTTRDLAEVVDARRTDMELHHRSGERYRRRLQAHFHQAGAGLWVRHGALALYELESAQR